MLARIPKGSKVRPVSVAPHERDAEDQDGRRKENGGRGNNVVGSRDPCEPEIAGAPEQGVEDQEEKPEEPPALAPLSTDPGMRSGCPKGGSTGHGCRGCFLGRGHGGALNLIDPRAAVNSRHTGASDFSNPT